MKKKDWQGRIITPIKKCKYWQRGLDYFGCKSPRHYTYLGVCKEPIHEECKGFKDSLKILDTIQYNT